jgi:effector-binding domain-containing protein
MIETPKLVEYPGQPHAAVVHLTIPRDAIQTEMKPAIEEILAVLAEQQVKPMGPLFAHHLTQSSETFDFEVGFPVTETSSIIETGRVKNSSLPSGTMAYTCHVGPYEELHAAWTEFEKWHISSSDNVELLKNRQRGDTLFEIYTIGPETTSDTSQWRTEMYQTLKST